MYFIWVKTVEIRRFYVEPINDKKIKFCEDTKKLIKQEEWQNQKFYPESRDFGEFALVFFSSLIYYSDAKRVKVSKLWFD